MQYVVVVVIFGLVAAIFWVARGYEEPQQDEEDWDE